MFTAVYACEHPFLNEVSFFALTGEAGLCNSAFTIQCGNK